MPDAVFNRNVLNVHVAHGLTNVSRTRDIEDNCGCYGDTLNPGKVSKDEAEFLVPYVVLIHRQGACIDGDVLDKIQTFWKALLNIEGDCSIRSFAVLKDVVVNEHNVPLRIKGLVDLGGFLCAARGPVLRDRSEMDSSKCGGKDGAIVEVDLPFGSEDSDGCWRAVSGVFHC